MIDWSRIDELRHEVGDEAFAEVVRAFVEEVDDAVERLRRMAVPGADDFHFLKGAALGLGFTALADGCARAERASRAGAAADPLPLISTYAETRRAFLAGLAPQV